MADWFVDAGIVGGNGTDPASAYPSVSSITWGAGDRAWVRRTHYEILNSSTFLGPNFSVVGFSRWGSVIGWPNAGDPFRDERPARGTTVGWDSDVTSTAVYSVFGAAMPTFAGSGTSGAIGGFLLPSGAGIYNCCLQQNATTQNDPWSSTNGTTYDRILDNVFLLQNSGSYNTGVYNAKGVAYFGKATIPFSGTGDAFSTTFLMNMRHLIIHSLSIIPGALFRIQTSGAQIGVVEVQTNSLAYVGALNSGLTGGSADEGDGLLHIGRLIGKRPVTANGSLGGGGWHGLQIDDFYGEGPRILSANGNPETRVASINEAQVNSINALIYQVRSQAAANQKLMTPMSRLPAIRAYFAVASGTSIEVRVPIYVDSTACFSPAGGMMRGYLQCANANPVVAVRSNVLVGSPTLWGGSLIAGGSAYLWSCVFSPAESGTLPFEMFLPSITQATSGTGITGQVFFGQPYKV